jgi:Rps23 Pro-64 3,4-dihydroxylase Tpa1-like proline 4-hydroxylase
METAGKHAGAGVSAILPSRHFTASASIRKPDPVNLPAIAKAFETFHNAAPFNYCVVDNFITPEYLPRLESEFLDFNSPRWFVYKNAIEDKKALNDWNAFPAATYQFFSYLNSPDFVAELGAMVKAPLQADNGLHGGGWHVHGTGGNLNPHLDYSIHPKAGLQRKINIIVYLSRELKPEHGGYLGLWDHDRKTARPGKLIHEVEPRFNRAIIFDTTQNSWHGMSRPLSQPEGIYRKSLAIYYLTEPPMDVDVRARALYAPREDQKGDTEVEALIRMRADVKQSTQVYTTEKKEE